MIIEIISKYIFGSQTIGFSFRLLTRNIPSAVSEELIWAVIIAERIILPNVEISFYLKYVICKIMILQRFEPFYRGIT